MTTHFIHMHSNAAAIQKKLNNIATQQFPYAIANALNDLAMDVQKAEKASLPKTFDRPTPFTMNSIRIIPARKNQWWARVFVMDIAAQYLFPYEVQGPHKLIGKGITWLNPKDKSLLNQYGNFPQYTLERLVGTKNVSSVGQGARGRRAKVFAGKPQFFIGEVTTEKGKVGGVWQRVAKGGKKGRGLKLLIRFGDPHPARQHLDFVKRAETIVQQNFNKRFGAALARAIATARP